MRSVFSGPTGSDFVRISRIPRKLERLDYCVVKNYNNMLSSFHRTAERNGETDRWTHRWVDEQMKLL